MIELMIALALSGLTATVGVALVVSVVGLARSQILQVEMQQSARSAEQELGRMLRTAGRGALPFSRAGISVSRGVALEVRNNLGVGGEDRSLARGWPGSPLVSEGSDALVVRGVFSMPMYVVDYRDPSAYSLARGTVRVRSGGLDGAEAQDLEPLRDLVAGGRGRPDALLLVGLGGERSYGVAELEPGRSQDEGGALVLAFRTRGSELAAGFGSLSPDGRFPDELSRVAYVGILEEYRYFVRDTDGRRTLARARLYPGTEIPWGRLGGELKVDLAEGVADLQVTLGFDSELAGGGFDSDPDAQGEDDRIVESEDGRDDDWLFNSPDDDPLDDAWLKDPPAPPPSLHLVRVRLVSLAARSDRHWTDEPLTRLEDRVYGRDDTDPVNGPEALGRRRWISTLTVGPRGH